MNGEKLEVIPSQITQDDFWMTSNLMEVLHRKVKIFNSTNVLFFFNAYKMHFVYSAVTVSHMK